MSSAHAWPDIQIAILMSICGLITEIAGIRACPKHRQYSDQMTPNAPPHGVAGRVGVKTGGKLLFSWRCGWYCRVGGISGAKGPNGTGAINRVTLHHQIPAIGGACLDSGQNGGSWRLLRKHLVEHSGKKSKMPGQDISHCTGLLPGAVHT